MAGLLIPHIRVCHIASGDLWAGAEVMAFTLLKTLRCYPDVSLHVILLNEGHLAHASRGEGISVSVCDESCRSFIQLAREVRCQLEHFNPHVVHSHRYKENLLALLGTVGKPGIWLVATQHGLPESGRGPIDVGQKLKAWLNFRLLAGWFDRTVAVSKDLCRLLAVAHRLPVSSLEVIYNGIELPVQLSGNVDSDTFVIGSSGRLSPVKGYRFLVEIAREVADPSIRFILAGEGPERAMLEQLVTKCRLQQRFRLLGHLQQMDTFYRGLNLFVNTSFHEGIPLAVLEALARGIPVLAPAVGGLTEIIEDGVQGFLIAERDASLFARRCLLLRNDPGLRRKMSEAARKRAETLFSSHQMAKRYYRLYRELLRFGSPVDQQL